MPEFEVPEDSNARVVEFVRAFRTIRDGARVTVNTGTLKIKDGEAGSLDGACVIGVGIDAETYVLLPAEARLIANTFEEVLHAIAARCDPKEAVEGLEGVSNMILGLRYAAEKSEEMAHGQA